MTRIKAVGHVGIRVRDVERAVAFYKRVLDLKHVVAREKFHAFEVGGTHFCIQPGKPQKEVAFDFTTDDVDGLNRKLGSIGVHVSRIKVDRVTGCRSFYFVDPDGHRVRVTPTHAPLDEVRETALRLR